MAITFVAAGAIAVGLSGADPAAPYPAGLQANDRLVLVVVNGPATEPGAQTGFTKEIGGLSGTGSQSPAGAIYHKAATGSESGNFTVTNNTAGTCRAILLAYRGVDTTTPIDVAATEASIGSTTAYTVGGQTTSVVGVTFVGFTVSNSATGTMTPPTVPAAWVERVDSIADSPHTSAADLVAWSGSGASGNFNFVRSASVRGYAAVIALRPTSGATTGTASATETTTLTSSGRVGKVAAATLAATVAITATGVVGRSTGTSIAETVAITAAGTVATGAVSASATIAETTAVTSTGVVGKSSTASIAETTSITAAGVKGTAASATRTETVAVTAAGRLGTSATASRTSTVTITAAGSVVGAGSSASATRSETVALTTSGLVGRSTSATRAETVTLTTAGTVGHATTGAVSPVVGITATGTVGVAASAAVGVTATVTAEGINPSTLRDITVYALLVQHWTATLLDTSPSATLHQPWSATLLDPGPTASLSQQWKASVTDA